MNELVEAVPGIILENACFDCPEYRGLVGRIIQSTFPQPWKPVGYEEFLQLQWNYPEWGKQQDLPT